MEWRDYQQSARLRATMARQWWTFWYRRITTIDNVKKTGFTHRRDAGWCSGAAFARQQPGIGDNLPGQWKNPRRHHSVIKTRPQWRFSNAPIKLLTRAQILSLLNSASNGQTEQPLGFENSGWFFAVIKLVLRYREMNTIIHYNPNVSARNCDDRW
jgi:hypothetical protein